MNVSEFLASLKGEPATETSTPETVEKVASASDSQEPMEKLAAELESAGQIMADSFVDRCLDRFEKVAAGKALSSHAGGVAKSKWQSVADKIGKPHGSTVPSDEGHTRAEDVYKHRLAQKKVGHGREA